MSTNSNGYDIDPHVAELYDAYETETDDIDLIRSLISGLGQLRILEPFCGTGRVLIPLADDGHEMVGLDQSRAMLDRARQRIAALPAEGGKRVRLIQVDATAGGWPGGFDVVLLGGNCFYELATPREQEDCIAAASAALNPGGCVYVDNDHMEDKIPPAWLPSGKGSTGFPKGTCADGTRLEGTTETLSFDRKKRIWLARRGISVISPDGTTRTVERLQQKHPVRFEEVRGWLAGHGFAVERTFGDRSGNPYHGDAPRAIFWARKQNTGDPHEL